MSSITHNTRAVNRERERLLSSGRAALATGSSLGLEFFRLSALGLGWLEATSYGALRLSDLVPLVLVACGLATPRNSMARLLGELGILLFCSPGFCGVGCLLRALSSS